MNREILFRAKQIENGEWIEGLLFYNTDKELCIQPFIQKMIRRRINPETVCQLLVNSRICKEELFDKDIVKIKLPSYINELNRHIEGRTFVALIEYDEFDGRTWANEYHNGESDWDFHLLHEDMIIEKLGNFFDNPELLEQSNDAI